MTESSNKDKEGDKIARPNSYVKYSGLAMQMGVLIGLGAWGGQWLDKYYSNQTPVWTIVLCLTGVFVSLYLLIRGFINQD